MKNADELGYIGFDKYFLISYTDVNGYSIINLYVLKITNNNIIYTSGTIFDGKPTNRLFIGHDNPDLFTSFEAAKEEIIKRSQKKIESLEKRINGLRNVGELAATKRVMIMDEQEVNQKDIKL